MMAGVALLLFADALICALSGVLNIAFFVVRRRSPRRYFRLVVGLTLLYFAAVYASALVGWVEHTQIGPTLLRPAILVLALLPGLEVLVDVGRGER